MSQLTAVRSLFICLLLLGATRTSSAAERNLQALLQDRLDTAREGFKLAEEDFHAGKSTWESVASWSQRWMQAQQALDEVKPDPLAAQQAHLKRLKQLEGTIMARHKAGQVPVQEVLAVKFQRQGAEIDLAKATSTSRPSFYEGRNGLSQVPLAPPPPPLFTPKTTATIIVRLPATAKLFFDGVPTTLKGDYRRFIVNELESGFDYYYDLRATWMENGNEVPPARQTIRFRAGEHREFDFRLPPAERVRPVKQQ